MSDTPSRRDGVSLELENRIRFQSTRYLERVENKINLGQDVTAAAVIFCHRFFLREPYTKHKIRVVATACYLLACKDRDRFLKNTLFLLVETMVSLMNADFAARRMEQVPFNYEKEKQNVLDAENLVLRTLNFGIGFTLPCDSMLQFTQKLKKEHPEVEDPFVDAMRNVNYGYLTCFCLRFNAKEIAAAGLLFLAETKNLNLPQNWYQDFNVTLDRLEEVYKEMKQEREWIRTSLESNYKKFVCCETWVDP